MEVYLKKVSVDVPAKDYAESCEDSAEFADIICEIGHQIVGMDECAKRILINSIPHEMSVNGRKFIELLYGAILRFDKMELETED